jgi:chloride channel protein, CIC family
MLRRLLPPSFTEIVAARRSMAARELPQVAIWAVLVGLLGALAAMGFRWLSTLGQWLLTRHTGSFVETAKTLAVPLRVAVPTLGGLLAGLVLHQASRWPAGQGSGYLEALTVGDGGIPAKPSLIRSGSSLLSVASGSSIGREGALVQLAATIASALGRWRGWPIPQRRLLVACGAAAGIASAYDAPIAAAFFVGELGFGPVAIDGFAALLLSSAVATATSRLLLNVQPLFLAPDLRLVSLGELAPCLALGLLAGCAAPVFLRWLWLGRRLFGATRLPLPLRLGLGGLLVGVASSLYPEVWGNGYSVARSMLRSDWAWHAVALTLLFKLLATGAATGSGAVGGVFTPTLFVGAALGWLFGLPVGELWPASTAPPSVYALVGMGAFLASATHAPIMASLMVFEMSLNSHLALPLLLACIAGDRVARAIDRRSLYSHPVPIWPPPAPPHQPLSRATR